MRDIQQWRHLVRGPWPAGVILGTALVACGGEKAPPADTTAAPGGAATASAAGAGSAQELYQRCVTCHQANGEGVPGSFPALAGSEYATAANVAVPIRIVLHGMQGPVTVKGVEYNGLMPAYGTGVEMTDEEVAAVLTYARSSWGNGAGAVTPQQVAEVRAAARSASGPVTAAELKPLM